MAPYSMSLSACPLLSSRVALSPVIPHLAGNFFQITIVGLFESSGDFPPVSHSADIYRKPVMCQALCQGLRSNDPEAPDPVGKAKTQTEVTPCPEYVSGCCSGARPGFPSLAQCTQPCCVGRLLKAHGGPLSLRLVFSCLGPLLLLSLYPPRAAHSQ